MPYTKTGPFVPGAAPGISATFLNEVERFCADEAASSKDHVWQTISTDTDVSLPKTGYLEWSIGSITLPTGWGSMDLYLFGLVETIANQCVHLRFYLDIREAGVSLNLTSQIRSITGISGSSWNNYDSALIVARKLGATGSVALHYRYTFSNIISDTGAAPIVNRWSCTALKLRRG
jgi:hypothetical protein